ncbi:MAG: hypothetical protein CL820_03070 [Croceicoccus sp.]|nr:hypothetical protein [Erythrobacteraceae bacterium]MAL24865.1 hypothetical protein [Croceicoccus sp.]
MVVVPSLLAGRLLRLGRTDRGGSNTRLADETGRGDGQGTGDGRSVRRSVVRSLSVAAPDPRPLPDLPQLERLGGSPVTPEDLTGQPFVVNLWATWCPPCRRELPMLADMAATSDIPILLINQGEEPRAIQDYLLANRVSPAAVVLDRSSAMMRALENTALPATLFVDESGQVVATHVGEISRAAMTAQMDELRGE